MNKMQPDFSFETRLYEQGFQRIAGCDEAGRGPLAGPVVAAAVVLNPNAIPDGLNDSKRLTKHAREKAFSEIMNLSHAISFCSISPQAIDEINILKATLKAMSGAIEALMIKADYALIDGNIIPPLLPIKATAVIKGDQRSLSIAAASIVAKVIRDKMMERVDQEWPAYGFSAHSGYGTKQHKTAIDEFGAVHGLHRMSFSPLKITTMKLL
jgi:ribonuclease HII